MVMVEGVVIEIKGEKAKALMLAVGSLLKMAGYTEGDDIIKELMGDENICLLRLES
jgi:hypothetical protein